LIPCTRNHAGFPEGIAGRELVERMQRQARIAGAQLDQGRVDGLTPHAEGFLAQTSIQPVRTKTVLLATGVTNRAPDLSPDLHAAALAAGRLRYCPICDGFEVTDQMVGVIGSGARGVKEALFLRAYTARLTLVSHTPAHILDDSQRAELSAGGIQVVDGPATDFRLESDGLSMATAAGRLKFDSIYPALGSEVHSDLAKGLGAAVTDDGCIKVDDHQRTSVPGLYAAGDVVSGLDQISHAMGEAGVAATTIRNDLAKAAPLRR
jgi:thioredoxin reductase (NADPH)